MQDSGDESQKDKIVRLINSATPAKKSPTRRSAKPTIQVQGNGNTVAGRDVIHTERVTVRHDFTPGPQHITEEQAHELMTLMDEIVKIEKGVKKTPRNEAAVRGAFKTKFKLGSYRALASDRFDEAKKYLQTEIGRLRSAKSAPKKLDDQRSARYKAIHARERQLGISQWRKDYVKDRFGKESLTELSDQQLEQTYRAVMGKK